jgi:single-stranded-DNA-specific exonuclease
MAAGVTIRPGQLGPFRSFLAQALSVDVTAARAATALPVDAALTARGASVDLVRDLERAGPFGSGNPGPVFAFPAHRAKFAQVVGKGGHVSFALVSEDGARLKAIAFRAASTAIGDALLRDNDAALHFAGSLGIDHYQGREQVQFRLTDLAKPKS